MYHITEDEDRIDLTGRRDILFGSDGLDYSAELTEGEYVIKIASYGSDEIGDYMISIEDLDDQRQYVDLGVLELPYNTTLELDAQSVGNAEFDFELLEATNATIFLNYEDGCGGPSPIDYKLFNSEGVVIVEGAVLNDRTNFRLEKGNYKLSSNTKITLILNDPLVGDIDFGILSNFPSSVTLNVDLTYEPDFKQRFYFEVLEEVNLEGSFYLIDIYSLNGTEWENLSWSSPITTLQSGKYFIVYEATYEDYDPSSGDCEQEYRIITDKIDLLFDTN